ncbi:MHS family MFS transporter [Arthrobacter sp. zg-Y411]|uniref:MFS transporter n=1 Tax=Arthrobacter zhangbolii TaxID=2886936 RepID=UPI001D1587EB|nr:MHS family MFS transporter [Arthrobacter zhangbolii]
MSTNQTPAVDAETRTRMAKKAGFASFAGTTVEWYDFYAYGTASALVFGQIFFPAEDAAVGTLAAFATFWVGFLARPLGGVVFGHFGDKFGRKKALVTTLLMMGICTTAVGLLPTYGQIGMWAAVILVFLRLIQGIAMGGEWGGAVVLAAEHAPKGKGIIYGAFAQQGSPMGNLLSTLVWLAVAQLPDEQFLSWGWRIPFLLSAVLVGIGLFIRLSIEESPAMKEMMVTKTVAKTPFTEVLRHSKGIVVLGIGACIIAVSATYFKGTFALAWAVDSGLFDRSTFLTIVTIALVVQFCVQPFGAVIASKMDLRKAVLLLLVPELVFMPLMFIMIGTGNYLLAVVGMAVATIPHSMYYAALAGILAKSFPPNIRYTGISLSYQLSSTLFAGTAPMMGQYLLNVSGSILAVVALALVHVGLTIGCVLGLLARSRNMGDGYASSDSFSTQDELPDAAGQDARKAATQA